MLSYIIWILCLWICAKSVTSFHSPHDTNTSHNPNPIALRSSLYSAGRGVILSIFLTHQRQLNFSFSFRFSVLIFHFLEYFNTFYVFTQN